MKKKVFLLIGIVVLIAVSSSGCANIPYDAFNFTEPHVSDFKSPFRDETEQTPTIKPEDNTTAKPQVNTEPIVPTEDCLYFRPNGGLGGASFYFNEDMSVSTAAIDSFVYRKGYVLKGWNTRPDGTGKVVESEEVAHLFKNKTLEKETVLYAMWEKDVPNGADAVREVVYTSNMGGRGGCTQYITDLSNSSYIVLAPMVYSEDSVFLYWNTSPYRDGDNYYPGDEISSQFGTLNLYAVWAKKDTLEVNEFITPNLCWDSWFYYYGNGAKKGGKQAHVSGGGFTYYTIENEKVAGEYKDHTFKCWNTKADGTGKTFYPGDRVFSLGEIEPFELYAIWENT